MKLPITAHPQGAALAVKAQPGARQAGVGPVQDGWLKVRVTVAPERGKANEAMRALLARAFKLRKSQVQLLHGQTSPAKQFLIVGLSPDELGKRLAGLLGQSADR